MVVHQISNLSEKAITVGVGYKKLVQNVAELKPKRNVQTVWRCWHRKNDVYKKTFGKNFLSYFWGCD